MSEKKTACPQATESATEPTSGAVDHSGPKKKRSPPEIHIPFIHVDLEPLNVFVAHIRSAVVAQFQGSSNPSTQIRSVNELPTKTQVNPSSTDDSHSSVPSFQANAGPQWIHPYASAGFDQENGVSYYIDDVMAKGLAQEPPVQCSYYNPIKVGRGEQNNRNIIEYDENNTCTALPNMNGHIWINPQTLPSPSDTGVGIIGKQFNGIVVRRKKTTGASGSEK
ncbi:hypothetical protein ACHAPU_005400 [Fusarium lateritium]